MKVIDVSHSTCVGCRLCEMICSLVHEGECSTSRSRIRIFRDEEFGNNLVSLCMQCEEAHCRQSCPVEAIARDETTGAMLVDSKLCNGCEACLQVCPLGAVLFDRQKGTAFICDLCGGDPECVKFCSRDALALRETEIASLERKALMDQTSKLLAGDRPLRR